MARQHAGHPLYAKRVKRIKPDKLIGYWALDDENTATAFDQSNQGNNGTYSGVTLAAAWSPFGRKCPSFDGTNDYINVFSAGLVADFNGAEFTFVIWANMANWADGGSRTLLYLRDDAYDDYFYLYKDTDNKIYFNRTANGTNKLVSIAVTGAGWKHIAGVVSEAGDYTRLYVDGVSVGTPTSAVGTYADDPTFWDIGASDAHSNPWNGYLAHAAVWNTPLSASEILDLSKLQS